MTTRQRSLGTSQRSSLPSFGLLRLFISEGHKKVFKRYTLDKSKYLTSGLIYGGIPFLHTEKYERFARNFRIDLQLLNLHAFEKTIWLLEAIAAKEQNVFLPCWVASMNASAEGATHFYTALTISFFIPGKKGGCEAFPSDEHISNWITMLSLYLEHYQIQVKKPNAKLYWVLPQSPYLGFRAGYYKGRDLSDKEALKISQRNGAPAYNPLEIEELVLGIPSGLTEETSTEKTLTGEMLHLHDFYMERSSPSYRSETSIHSEETADYSFSTQMTL